VLIGACTVLVAAFLGWLGWVIWAQSSPRVESHLVGYRVVDEHAVDATIDVDLAEEDVQATCTLRASAEDHTIVGELTFRPEGSGRSEQTVRTERRATTVELLGCNAPGQNRAR
jgi:hypothetical protein